MLALSTLGINNNNGRDSEIEGLSMDRDDFEFTSENFLNSIDFDDLFMGFGNGDDLLPDLDMDPESFADFSDGIVQDGSEVNFSPNISSGNEEEKAVVSVSVSDIGSGISESSHSEDIVSKVSEPIPLKASCKDSGKGRKSSAQFKKTSSVKNKKVKVDWTPELHRRFVQAVEQLGVDKAVPSRILEIMGLDSLTRHNIASHLQKYRSHRRHLLAREAEAASWTHKRQMYAAVPSTQSGQKPLEKKIISPWIAPPMGFPHGPPQMPPHFRPLHVWGHPSVDQSFMHMWPKHLTPPPPPHHYAWPPVQHPHFFTAPTKYPITPKAPGIPPMSSAVSTPRPATMPQSSSDVYPSKENVDAAIGEILSKPWQPLPLGLKPPSIDTVMMELQSQGISKIPPSCA